MEVWTSASSNPPHFQVPILSASVSTSAAWTQGHSFSSGLEAWYLSGLRLFVCLSHGDAYPALLPWLYPLAGIALPVCVSLAYKTGKCNTTKLICEG